ncbi:MAG: septation protein A [Burkholderiales bacterium]|jgi:intracellular septation protein|nr:septation protein A [Burkholderiales bacterium]
MKLLLDFLPILLFVVTYKLSTIYVATGVLMVATIVQMGITYAIERQLTTMHKMTLGMVLVFGALTLVLQNETFIKWKPTVLYIAMALAMCIAMWIMKKNYLKLMLGSQLELPDAVWMRLNVAWMLYCLFMAGINGYVAAYYSTDEWVNFKIWGYVFPLAFMVGQGIYISRYLGTEQTAEADAADKQA